ncbi:MAG: hypothetical protein RIE73_19580 [Coleofasciculus sp. C1-SOL-03]|jgi:hypothetical protein|uniref:hypothetical protein n=1 Tax=Coleofasciculus sp. C1-SOL-03 TaxID=3069522 RepID=UPI0032FB2A64
MSTIDLISANKNEEFHNIFSESIDSLFTNLSEDVEESIAGGGGTCHASAVQSVAFGFGF